MYPCPQSSPLVTINLFQIVRVFFYFVNKSICVISFSFIFSFKSVEEMAPNSIFQVKFTLTSGERDFDLFPAFALLRLEEDPWNFPEAQRAAGVPTHGPQWSS